MSDHKGAGTQSRQQNSLTGVQVRARFICAADDDDEPLSIGCGFSLALPVAGGTLERSDALCKESKGNASGQFQSLLCYRNMTFTCSPSGKKLSAVQLKPSPPVGSASMKSVIQWRAEDVDSGWKHAVCNP